ncbi:MAG: hypothetical protein A2W91_11120 [Bacteroidetes bacterium GWF2_38_335]|nr:MAG: hypothetical protein A2W91_11120 [Bacteroidetes bacterium GWF2_38_335]OFY81750.1 MAG: hypothetical protein A2281_05920 [Bacteroidetes bacterium RIFOXYA12_FULL_38_20]HBS87817.1 nitroreductase [Bacteroidales bacterium]
MKIKNTLLISALFIALNLFSQSDTIKLPAPQTTGGMPLMEALKNRCSTRSFDAEKSLSNQQLSNLLWAANGINRPETGKRTAPSAVNWQEIEIFVATKDGAFRYLPKTHALLKLTGDDVRKDMGKQNFTADAAVDMVFVADYSKMNGGSNTTEFYAATDCGFVSQNVYLFCASEGLGTVVLGYIDRDKITEKLKLGKDQKVVLSQAVGFMVGEFEEE